MTITISDLERLVSELRDANRERTRIDRELDDIYFNEHKVEVVESPVLGVEPEILHLGRVPVTCEFIEGMFEQYPVASVVPVGIGVRAHDEAERIEKFLNAAIKQAERESGESTYDFTKQEVIRFGRSFECVLRADSEWKDGYPRRGEYKSDKMFNKASEDYKRVAPLPIKIHHIPISPTGEGISAMPVLSASKLIGFLSVHKLTVAEIFDRFGKPGEGRRPESLLPIQVAMNEQQVGLTDLLTVVTYYDRRDCVYAVLDGPYRGIVREYQHDMGCMPVILYEGITTNSNAPDRRWKSVYQDAREVVVHEDRLASRQATNIRINYYKSYFAIEDPLAGGEGGSDPIVFKPGQLTVLQGVKEFGAVNTETASQEAQLLEAKLEKMLERHLLPAMMMGQQGAADEPAWGANLRIKQGERRFKRIGTNLAVGRTDLCKAILHAVISIGERVYAIDEDDKDWSITPEEAKTYMNRIRVKIEPRTIPDLNADVQAAQGLDGLKVPKRAIFEDVLGYEQPIALMVERVLEDLQFDPQSPLFQQTVDLIIRRAQLMQEADDAATQADMEAAMPQVGPGAQEALAALLGTPAANGGLPIESGIPIPPFEPAVAPAQSPEVQTQMKTGRQQGRQPRPKALPGRPPRYKPE